MIPVLPLVVVVVLLFLWALDAILDDRIARAEEELRRTQARMAAVQAARARNQQMQPKARELP